MHVCARVSLGARCWYFAPANEGIFWTVMWLCDVTKREKENRERGRKRERQRERARCSFTPQLIHAVLREKPRRPDTVILTLTRTSFCFVCKYTQAFCIHTCTSHWSAQLRTHNSASVLLKEGCIAYFTFQAQFGYWRHFFLLDKSKTALAGDVEEQETGGEIEDRYKEEKNYWLREKRDKREVQQAGKKAKTENRLGECPSCLAPPGSSLELLVAPTGLDNLPMGINSSGISSNTNLIIPSVIPASLWSWPLLICLPPAQLLTGTMTNTVKDRWH